MALDMGQNPVNKIDERFTIDTRNNYVKEMAEKAADFQDMHGRNLFRRNMLPFDPEHADPKKLEEMGYVVDVQKEHKGNCTHYRMRLLKIVDTEEYQIKYTIEVK